MQTRVAVRETRFDFGADVRLWSVRMTEQKIEALSEPAPYDRSDLGAALRELSAKIEGNTEKLNEALMRVGYSASSVNSAASDSLAAAKLLGDERKKLAEIVTRPAIVWRQRLYVTGALLIGLIIGLFGPTVLDWVYNLMIGQ